MSRQRRERQKDRHDENYKRAFDLIVTTPPEAQEFFARLAGDVAEIGNRLQLPPVPKPRNLAYGDTPVPYTVSWTGEEAFFVDRCAYFGQPAICQAVALGAGQPRFGKPHSQRQRETIALGLCDLCGLPLRNRTKVSLSHARPQVHGAEGLAVLQVEPLLHRECAAASVKFCPALRRDIRDGLLRVRQVTRSRAQCAVMGPEYIAHYVPGYPARPEDRILGHAKVELIGWVDRSAGWLDG